MRQIANKSNCIGKRCTPTRQGDVAHRWIQGGKQLIGSIRIGMRQGIEQGRFPRIGIANQGDARNLVTQPRPPHLSTLHRDAVEALL